MKVTPVKKSFGKYKVGQVFEFPSKAAKVYIKLGKLAAAPEEVEVIYSEKVVVENVHEEVEISPRTGLPKRVYRRRDMESE